MTEHDPSYYCGAKKKDARGGGPCGQRAGAGTGHVGVGRCRWHGGASPNAERAGLAAVTERSFYQWLEVNGVPDSGDPVATMTRLLGRVVAWHDYIEHLVGELHIEDWEKRSRSEEGVVTTQLSVYVALLERAQDRAARHLAQFVKLGIEERLARLTERQGEAILSVLLGTIDDLELGEEKRQLALGFAGSRLALLAGGLPS